MKRQAKPRLHKIARIYHGPPGAETSMYWEVEVIDAKSEVTISGNVMHALRGYRGVTVGCALSNMAIDKANRAAFPHPVYLASFTKSSALIVDKLKKDGLPARAVRYRHSYAHITDQNDDNTLKKLAKEAPELMDKSFTLRKPRAQTEGRSHTRTTFGVARKTSRNFVPKGALARAVKAGRISRNAAKHLMDVSKS